MRTVIALGLGTMLATSACYMGNGDGSSGAGGNPGSCTGPITALSA